MVALWMLVASVFFALMGASIKLASVKVGFFEIVFYRSFINVLIVAALIKIKNLGFRTRHLGLHMKRAAIGNAAMYCGFYSLIHLPIATATTLGYTNPIFQSVITFVTAKGQLTGRLLFSVLLGFVGILVLLRPDVPHGAYAATLIGLLSGLLTALAYFNVGKLVRTGEPELRVVFYFSLVGTLVGVVMTGAIGFSALDLATLLNVCAIGVFGSLGQITMTRAYGSGNPVIVSILSYSTIIFSTLLGFLLFNEKLSSIAAAGMALIILSGGLAIARRPSAKTRKSEAVQP
ncbi:DMT family transporter [Serratia sp. AKBS12]|uniref:DMT family transporter n=1 Tax=Serratia sp. AKBS12 TaxID=2974597 RepID=UPI00216620FD|nr:DMT family transporter [Serratia sp. AKBS12]MCS3407856.1 DMT family transporter [Serratia sp. AKBS12]HEI8866450.1 DMT family transporter [Serratia odorifera]